MMKVALDVSVLGTGEVFPHSRTGIYRVVERLAHGLAASAECELRLIAPADDFYPMHGARRYLDRQRSLSERRLEGYGARERLKSAALDAIRAARAAGERLPPGSLPARAAYRLTVGAELRLVHARRYPVRAAAMSGVEIHHSAFGPLPPAAARLPGVRYVATVYDVIALRHPELFEPHVPEFIRASVDSITTDDWVLAISEATKSELCAVAPIDPDRVVVAPLAASADLFGRPPPEPEAAAIRARYGIPGAPYFLSLCTLEPRKNLDHAIECFAAAVEEEGVGPLNLVLVGSRGWSYDPVFAAVERLGIQDRVIFTGRVADEDLAAVYGGATGFVYPSLAEGFGLPPLEAMQCGVPVITSDRSSLPEVVGEAGLLVDPQDPEALRRAYLQLHRDEALRERLAAAGRARATAFSWDRFIDRTLHLYRTALTR